MKKSIIGIDEAGRGPLAGPVAVGIAVVPHDFDWTLIPGVGDSKQVSEKNREAIFLRAETLKNEGMLNYVVSLVSAHTIDRIGISRAVIYGIERGLAKLALDPAAVSIKLDGLLKAPAEYNDQETIIKGDAKELIIGLASILAKVTRDRVMVLRAREYPEYGFEIHKGYGTKAHGIALSTHGLSPIHRRSFCKRYLTNGA
jgi:ribonuclease HII